MEAIGISQLNIYTIKELFNLMSKQQKHTTETKKDAKEGNCPIDEKPLKNMFGNDPVLLKEILNDFIAPTQKIIREIKTGWEKRSAEEVEMAAHKLKSSAKSVGAFELGDICSTLETAGMEKDWETIDKFAPLLDSVMNEVEQYIKGL
jgi:HPt (histidine-containing phosphotransfer) domain-containing protein